MYDREADTVPSFICHRIAYDEDTCTYGYSVNANNNLMTFNVNYQLS